MNRCSAGPERSEGRTNAPIGRLTYRSGHKVLHSSGSPASFTFRRTQSRPMTPSDFLSTARPLPGCSGYRQASLPATRRGGAGEDLRISEDNLLDRSEPTTPEGSISARSRIPGTFHGLRRCTWFCQLDLAPPARGFSFVPSRACRLPERALVTSPTENSLRRPRRSRTCSLRSGTRSPRGTGGRRARRLILILTPVLRVAIGVLSIPGGRGGSARNLGVGTLCFATRSY